MTPQQLRTLIDSQPDGSPIRVAYAAGDDTGVARLLSARSQRGYAPIRELSAYCVTQGITGTVLALDEISVGADIAPGVTMTMQVKGLLKTIRTLIQDEYRLELVDLDAPQAAGLLDGLQSLGVISSAQRAAIVALGENRVGLVADGVSAEEVARTRGV